MTSSFVTRKLLFKKSSKKEETTLNTIIPTTTNVDDIPSSTSNEFRDLFIVILMFYPSICGMAFRFFQCQQIGNISYLISDLNLKCYDNQWFGMLVLILFVIFFFCIGLPLGIFIYLRRHKDKLYTNDFKDLVGPLYLPYKKEYYGMESLYMSLKLIMWATLVFFRSGSPLQFATSVLLSVIQLSIQLIFQPFKKKEVNKMQQTQLSLGVVTSVVSLCFKYISSLIESDRITELDLITYTTSKDILGIILLLLTISSYIYFAFKIINRYLNIRKEKNTKTIPIDNKIKDTDTFQLRKEKTKIIMPIDDRDDSRLDLDFSH